SARLSLAQLERTTTKLDEKLLVINGQVKADASSMRQSLEASFHSFNTLFSEKVSEINKLQKEKFAQLEEHQHRLVATTEKRLDQIKETVDEKLQKTLQERLGQSFDLVSKQLSAVQQGLGEMQTIAQDV